MLGILRKTTVLSATLMLLLQGVCLAESAPCTCAPDATSVAEACCCCGDPSETRSIGCPHCQKGASSQPVGENDTAQSNGCCHCHLTVPASGMPFCTPDFSGPEFTAVSVLAEGFAPYIVVCCPQRSAAESARLPLPDTSFRQIVLCVWLT